MSGVATLGSGVWAWLLAELLLSGVAWAAYRLLRRALRTAADRFLFLRLSFAVLLVMPWLTFVPALPELSRLLPQPTAGSWVVTMRSPLPVAGTSASADRWPLWALAAQGLAVLYLAWAVRCVVSLGRAAYQLQRLAAGAEVCRLPGGATILLHDDELPPATVGFFRPQILISRRIFAELDQRAVQLILRHEAVHIRRRDGVWNALVGLLRALSAYNPLMRALARHFESEMELSVDEAVLADPNVGRREYGQLLLDLSTRILPAAAPSYGGVYIARSLIARRISAMTRPVPGKRRPIFTVAAFAALSLFGGLGVATLPGPRLAVAGSQSAADVGEPLLQLFLVEPAGTRSVADDDGTQLPLAATPILTAADLDKATFNDGENPTVSVHLRPAAAARFAAFSGSHIGRKLAILLSGKLLAAPVIKSRIEGESMLLSGHFPKEMQRLAATINAGRATPR